ncbi:MAG: GntR family transcriptional regulator, partial [Alphaproteobacteria bacterium]|nr:GntR family transcriptional regulator [Alphaproteobacteria bacterium]
MRGCDCHMHLFGPAARYPYAEGRHYTPPDATLPDYLAMRARLGLGRTVFVQPSVYGYDHRLMLDALAAGGDGFRGVAVLPVEVSEAELMRLHGAGVRGVRVNLVQRGGPGPAALAPLAARIAHLGWHVQVYPGTGALVDLAPLLRALPVAVVIDHYGSPGMGAGTADAA